MPHCSLLIDVSAAGRQRISDMLACLCGNALGGLLQIAEMSRRMPLKELVRGMRYLYILLHWTSQRIAELVRTSYSGSAAKSPAVHQLSVTAQCMLGRSARVSMYSCAPSHLTLPMCACAFLSAPKPSISMECPITGAEPLRRSTSPGAVPAVLYGSVGLHVGDVVDAQMQLLCAGCRRGERAHRRIAGQHCQAPAAKHVGGACPLCPALGAFGATSVGALAANRANSSVALCC